MTRKQWANVYVGGVVHLLNWAYRVRSIDRQRGRVVIAKIPESVYPEDVMYDVGYRKLGYVACQKPPDGTALYDEEDVF